MRKSAGQTKKRTDLRHRVAGLGAGAASLALVLSGCGGLTGSGGPTTEDGDPLENAAEFLQQASAEWEESRPTQNVEVSEDAGCFFVLGEDEDVTGELACGGVRTSTAQEGEVWDIGTFEIRPNSDSEMEARLPEGWTAGLERGRTRPEGPVVDADGDEAPDSIDALAAPPMPQTDSGFILSGESLPGDLVQPGDEQVSPGDDGLVMTPGGRVTITSVATLETVPVAGAPTHEEGMEDHLDGDTDDGDIGVSLDGEPHAPADGETFVFVEYDYQPTERPGEDETSTAALALNAGGQQRTLAEFGEDDGWSGPSEQSGSFLASVPEDDAHLVVSSAGRDQVVDLPEGQREADPVTRAYYRDVTQQDTNHEFSIADQPFALDERDYEASMYLSLQSAWLTAYSEVGGADGWAEEDEAWLLLEFDAILDSDDFNPRFKELTPSLTVTDGAGETYSASRTIDIDTRTWNSTYWMAVAMPADVTEVTLSQTFETRVEDWDDNIATLTLETDSSTVDFPQSEPEASDDDSDDPDEDDDADAEADEADDADADADEDSDADDEADEDE
ncbi:hypothetical protein [Nesterenkonia sp. PF2B19]|uniref:hypothetical protein n=1 Tax=Nesterenkonia sp. PF2B19 TaxID=1881858 RepID=UPI0014831B58|nr:hypothetical protein [Nesterenkonia sp. PF2B19]